MREQEARLRLLDLVNVSYQHVVMAKLFLLETEGNTPFQTDNLIRDFTRLQQVSLPERIVIGSSVDLFSQLNQAADYLTNALALVQGVWSLIHEGYFIPGERIARTAIHEGYFIPGERIARTALSIRWTSIVPGDSGGGGWPLEELAITQPYEVFKSPQYRKVQLESFGSADLFVLEAGIGNTDEEIIEAVQDAIRCFRNELYRPCVTMLSKAMEGAWIELGLSLAQHSQRVQKIEASLKSDNGIAGKITLILKLYENAELDLVVKSSGIKPAQLQHVNIWSDVVREARNAIHFGVAPTIPNSYEKVSVLLLAAATNLKLLYTIKRAADDCP